MTDPTSGPMVPPLTRLEWVSRDRLSANSWNPNSVPPAELKLLAVSMIENSWTQPLVAHPLDETGAMEIVDGYHRWTLTDIDDRVAALTAGLRPGPNPSPRETELERVLLDLLDALDADADTTTPAGAAHGLLARYDSEDRAPTGVLVPVVALDPSTDLATRQMATVRHNRARGSHHVLKMADIVSGLLAQGLDAREIGRRLGMDHVEVERLAQRGRMSVRGPAADGEMSRAWHSEIPPENR